MNTIDITKKDLETIGTRSLEGLLVQHDMTEPGPITFRFQQSSAAWKHHYGGPDSLIMLEHVPMCLCASIVNLQRQGFTITIEHFIQDPVTK